MVQTYLKFIKEANLGLISSFKSNVTYLHTDNNLLAVVPALENISVWNLKLGEKLATWTDNDNSCEVTCIRASPDSKFCASGYTDGSIRLWDVTDNSLVCVLNGHSTEVTTLQFDKDGLRLLSGSRDTNLVVWDIVNQSGLYRLKGHKNQITQAKFIEDKNYIISTSKDSLIKIWDLSTQHCVQTLPGHSGEILSLTINKELGWVITGGIDANLKVWQINWDVLDKGVLELDTQTEFPLTHIGDLQRNSSEKVHQLEFHPNGSILFGLIGDKMVETWRIRTSDEIKKKLKRHLKKLKEKAAKSGEDQAEMEESISNAINQPLSPSDRITSWGTIRTQHRIRSFSTAFQTKPAQVSVLLGLTNNSVHVQTIALPDSDPKAPFEPQEQYQLELQGHRSEIRSVSLSSDDRLLASFGPGLVKIWDIETLQCIRTLECGHALCGSFLPGDRYVIVGTKSGNLQLFDLGSSTMVQDVKAHNGSIWSLDIRPDENGLVTGGGDKNVMFWDFKELNLENIGRHLQVEHVKTLQMTDDVLCVRYSPNQNLLAVALLDATVKVFYTDSLKLFLSLYGHKLPVMSMDISSDNSLILTGSADKNIKIWGLDFGDCHKSLFAHDEAVVGVRFQPKTHYFFSCGKDHQVRYWDGDRFESIMKLSGHLGEVWGLEISKKGRFVVSASGDRSIRIWVRTDEPLFLEEEREKEMEETYEQELIGNEDDGDEDEEGADRAGKATMESLKAGERIIEAVELCQREWERKAEYDQLVARGQNPPPPMVEPLLNALQVNGEQYLLDTIAKVKSAELEDALLVLPLSHVVHIFKCIEIWCKRRVQIPLICRITTFLTQTHHRQLVSNQLLKPVIDNVKEGLRQNLKQQKDIIGYNLMGLKHLEREYLANQTSEFFEAPEESNEMEEDKVTIKRKLFV